MLSVYLLNPIDEGCNNSFFGELDSGAPVFIKFYQDSKENLVGCLRNIELNFRRYFNLQILAESYRDESSLESLVFKEVETYRLWSELGVDVPNVLDYGFDYLVLNKLCADSVGFLIKREFDLGVLERTIFKFRELRDLAREKNDVRILHSDPHFDNFLCLRDSREIVPIDSSLLIREDLNFEQVDSRINLYFVYRMFDRIKQYSFYDVKKVFDIYSQSLFEGDKEFIVENPSISFLYNFYFGFREEFAHRIRKRDKQSGSIYTKESYQSIIALLG